MISSIISYAAAASAFAVALGVLLRKRWSLVHVVFTIGMVLFGLEALLIGLSSQASVSNDILKWQRYRLLVSSFLPGVWLVFSISFTRPDYQEFLARWKWGLVGVCIAPFGLALFAEKSLLFAAYRLDNLSMPLLRLGWFGYVLYLVYLILSVMILMNLERTFRNAAGHARWQIKFLVLGLGGIFAVRLYTGSQAVLFRLLDIDFQVIDSFALMFACIMIFRALRRTGILEFDLYLSGSAIHKSLTVLIVGTYFIVVGVLAKAAHHFAGMQSFPMAAFLLLVAILGLAALFLSDKVRYRWKKFVSRNFKRPTYDYQKIWTGFTENTMSVSSGKDLCLAVTNLVSHTLDVLSVSLWMVDEQQEYLKLGSSTRLNEDEAKATGMYRETGRALIRLLYEQSAPIDLTQTSNSEIGEFAHAYERDLQTCGVRYCVPLRAAGKLIGVITLGKRVMNQSLSFEDYELLRTMADQSGAALLNLKMSEKLRQAKELEAFQTMSAFFMHDLKNLASKLSLVTQNMPKHYDNEEFREDAMRTVTQSVDKIKGMCTRLSLLSQTPSTNAQTTTRLDYLVRSTVDGLNGVLKSTIDIDAAETLPPLLIDEEQMRKVLENLLINANEATAGQGNIRITMQARDEWVVLSVSDNGCGMTSEFLEKYAFKPFQTTKKQGMGIGLFHCKTIVEAHEGRIEVQSEEGKGSVFRVYLPIKS